MRKNRVKELRESIGLSQGKLGEEIGISQQLISKIERDDERLTKDNMLADFFQVSSDYLLGRSKIRRNLEQEQEMLNQYNRHYEFLQLYMLLGEQGQTLVRKIVAIMLEMRIKKEDENI